ncbi:hypothetical protein [Rhodococcus sp. HNM0569]|uniref:hypothetical protein n=1 Tax=Rhodococcus sp. HNM0569 TaxID=2716340 RepID=UPI00146DAE37|nr:hypothetical protein [Rhodococcus sp. HNM0569]NLU83691.1 hypothetical protein [Rhodococcus sp. HNM0569]
MSVRAITASRVVARVAAGGTLAAGALVVGAVGLAAPAAAVTATCPEGHVCAPQPPECPYEWKFDWGTGTFAWTQKGYCLDPTAVPDANTQAYMERQYAYNAGNPY